ncbi:MAG: DUF2339 domain-containing protein [bacterium]
MIYFILALILLVVVFTRLAHLDDSIKKLQAEIQIIKANLSAGNVSNSTQNTVQSVPLSQPSNVVKISVSQVDEIKKEVRAENQLENWFKENIIIKIGILMILAGFGWFASYAFMHNWIGPEGRISLGVALGVLLTIFGSFRLGKNKVQGVAFTILGSALVVISVLAGQYFYNFFSPIIVLAIAFIVSVYVSITALYKSYEDLVAYALILSLCAPYFSHTDSMDPVLLYTYLLVVSIGTIWISVLKKWKSPTVMGITGVLLYSLQVFWGGVANIETTKYTILLISYIMSLLYLGVNMFGLIKNKIAINSGDVYLTIVNTIIILGFTTSIVTKDYQSIFLIGWTLFYAISGYFVYKTTQNDQMFYIHTLASTLFLAVATSIEFSGQTMVIASEFEAVIICLSSFVVTRKIKIAENFSALMIVPFLLSLSSLFSSKWDTGIMHSDFVVLFIMTILLAVLGVFFRANGEVSKSELKMGHFMFICSTVYLYALVWLSSHALLTQKDMAVFISLFVYTIIGLITHFVGLFNRHLVLKNYGMALLIAVVARLVFVDVWNMELTLRIVTFIVLGVLFISTAFISRSQSREVVSQ